MSKLSILENYYKDIREFKAFFIRNCLTHKKYESYKVWAQWLIGGLCENSDNYHLLPSPEISQGVKPDILGLLTTEGTDHDEAESFYQHVTKRSSDLYHKYHQFRVQLHHDQELITEVSAQIVYSTYHDGESTYHLYRLNETYTKHNDQKHQKLLDQYTGTRGQLHYFMFEVGFNYYILDGHSLQWCLPTKVLDILHQKLGVRAELFASPHNNYHKLPIYGSLFAGDQPFGAVDNFFNLDRDQVMTGSYEIFPPFIERVLFRVANMVVNFLQISDQHGEDLLYVFVLPSSSETPSYQLLNNNKYLIDDVLLNEHRHYYYQSSNDRLVKANCPTHLMVMGTTRAQNRWTPEVKNDVTREFCYNERKPSYVVRYQSPFAKVSQL